MREFAERKTKWAKSSRAVKHIYTYVYTIICLHYVRVLHGYVVCAQCTRGVVVVVPVRRQIPKERKKK